MELLRKLFGTHVCPRCLAEEECYIDSYYSKGHTGEVPSHFCHKCGASWMTDFYTGKVVLLCPSTAS